MTDKEKSELYSLQEEVARLLQGVPDASLRSAKLCGGTALSRFWLNHRISYDLDYFLPSGLDAIRLAIALKKSGLDYIIHDIVDDKHKANQLHGVFRHGKKQLKVSFVEDAYFDVFAAIDKCMGDVVVRTESVEGLYHRKLRTVSGHGLSGESCEGGRQKARDLFDLYVLSQSVMPLRAFLQSLPYPFPTPAFEIGLACMPWFDLASELREIVCEPEWAPAKDVAFLQQALYQQMGITDAADDAPEAAPTSDTPQAFGPP